MEILDIVSENNELINKKETRNYIHKNNLWHRHVSCWIINEKGEILFQKRSANKKVNPNMWSKTGGHVEAGEEPIDALKREVKEELGINITNKDIFFTEIYKSEDETNKSFTYNYIVKVNCKLEDYNIQIEELSEVKYMSIEEMIHLKNLGNKSYTFNHWKDDKFYKQIEIIKKYSII